jgi:hypothetical protein
MLDSVNEHDVGVVVDLVHDPVVPAPSRPQSGELADEWLADSTRIVSQRAEHERDGGVPNLRWEVIEVPSALARDVDLVQTSAGEVIVQPDAFASCRLTSGSFDRCDEVRIAQDVQRLLQRFEVVGADEDERGAPVPGHEDAVVVLLHAICEFGQVRLGVGERHSLGHWSGF